MDFKQNQKINQVTEITHITLALWMIEDECSENHFLCLNLAYFFAERGIPLAMVNPMHVKRS